MKRRPSNELRLLAVLAPALVLFGAFAAYADPPTLPPNTCFNKVEPNIDPPCGNNNHVPNTCSYSPSDICDPVGMGERISYCCFDAPGPWGCRSVVGAYFCCPEQQDFLINCRLLQTTDGRCRTTSPNAGTCTAP